MKRRCKADYWLVGADNQWKGLAVANRGNRVSLHVLSDLHLELMAPGGFVPPRTTADIVILAGDIHTGTRGLTWAREQFSHQEVVYVAGNHEYYGEVWSSLLPRLRRKAKTLGIHFLENDSVELCGTRILGATLWTDFDFFGPGLRTLAMSEAAQCMNDFFVITVRRLRADDAIPGMGRNVPLTPEDTLRWHRKTRQWLTAALGEPFAGSTVVVTHHMPHEKSVHPRYARSIVNAAFGSDLSALMGPAALWIHGHTHDSMDYEVNGTRVLCNPRGYQHTGGGCENRGFQPDMVVEVGSAW